MTVDSEWAIMERRSIRDFPELVQFSHDLWRNDPRRFDTISSSIEVPQLAEWGMQVVRNNLPNYISKELSRKVIERHATPVVTISALEDKRLNLPSRSEILLYLDFPPAISSVDKDFWYRGIDIFDEIAVETLSIDILTLHGRKKGRSYNPLTKVGASYNKAYTELENIFRESIGLGKLKAFHREIVVASITQDKRGLEEFARSLKFDSFDALSIHIGKIEEYGKESNRLINSLRFNGTYGVFPGVISLIGLQKSLTIGAILGIPLLLGFTEMPPSFQVGAMATGGVLAIPDIVKITKEHLIHEMCHYFLSDITNLGLQPVVWKRKNFYNR